MHRSPQFHSAPSAIVKIALLSVLAVYVGVTVFASLVATAFYALLGADGAGHLSRAWLVGPGIMALPVVAGCIVALVPRARAWLPGWPTLAATIIVLGPVAAWLAWDEAPAPRPVIPAIAADAESMAAWRLSLAYAQVGGAAPQRQESKLPSGSFAVYLKSDFSERAEAVRAGRSEIEKAWAALAGSERVWLTELNRFPRIGDRPVYDPAAPIIRFGPLRNLFTGASAHSALLAIDGKGDEAIAELLPLLQVATKLEADAGTVVRVMIGRVGTRSAFDAIRFVVAQTTLSPACRRELLDVLQHPADPQVVARRIALVEYPTIGNVVQLWQHGGPPSVPRWAPVARLLTCTALNRTATANRWAEYCGAFADLAAGRDLDGVKALEARFNAEARRWHMKNALGWQLLSAGTPSFAKVVTSHWDTDDQRLALIAKLSGT